MRRLPEWPHTPMPGESWGSPVYTGVGRTRLERWGGLVLSIAFCVWIGGLQGLLLGLLVLGFPLTLWGLSRYMRARR